MNQMEVSFCIAMCFLLFVSEVQLPSTVIVVLFFLPFVLITSYQYCTLYLYSSWPFIQPFCFQHPLILCLFQLSCLKLKILLEKIHLRFFFSFFLTEVKITTRETFVQAAREVSWPSGKKRRVRTLFLLWHLGVSAAWLLSVSHGNRVRISFWLLLVPWKSTLNIYVFFTLLNGIFFKRSNQPSRKLFIETEGHYRKS